MSDGSGAEQISGYESDFDVEVMATNGIAPSRVKLHFTRNVNVYQRAEKPTNIHGKTYVVDAAAPRVRDASGGAAPEDEATRVLDVFPDLGTRTGIDQVLPDEPMTVGDRRDDLAGAVLAVLHPRAWTLRSGTATLARIEGTNAVFAVALDAISTSGVQMAVTGDVRVRLADARLASAELRGTYEASPTVKGEIEIRRSVRER